MVNKSQHIKPMNLSTNLKDHLQSYFEDSRKFHGYLSPGVAIGIIMVDLAKELLGHARLIDAVVETKACIPDAVQLMTGCTYGNGGMRVKDWGKMALTLYDKEKLDGVRVSINLKEVKNHPLIYQWYMRNGDINKEEVVKEIMSVGRNVLSWQRIKVTPYKKIKKARVTICASCGEAYPASYGDLCMRCSGKENYYE